MTGIQTNTVSAGALTKGQFFVASTTSNWAATTLSQDVVESATTPGQLTVQGLQTFGIAATTPTSNQVLTWNSGTLKWTPTTAAAGASVTGTGEWYSAAGTLNAAAVVMGQDVTQGALSGSTVPLTVTQLQNGVLTLSTGAALAFQSTQTDPILGQTSESTATQGANLHIQPQQSTHATNQGGGNVSVDLQAPTGSGAEAYLEVTRGGSAASFVGPVPTVGATMEGLWLQTTAPSTTNHAIRSDGSNTIVNAPNGDVGFTDGNVNMGYMSNTIVGGRTAWWALNGAVPSTANYFVSTDAASLTYFNGIGTLGFILNGATFAAYASPSGFVIGGSSSAGGGTGTLTLANASVAPTAIAATGTANLWNTTSGLFYSGSSGTTNFDPIAIAPFHSISALNTQFVGSFLEKEWIRTTAETALTACAIPIPDNQECAGVHVRATGKLIVSSTVQSYVEGGMSWCSNGSSLSPGTPFTNTTSGAAGAVVFSTLSVLGLVQVESAGAQTVDWTVECQWDLN